MATDERVTVINDGAGDFEKTVQGSQLARARIPDWFGGGEGFPDQDGAGSGTRTRTLD
ncbi:MULTISPECIES: hypothetical protein [unclassified Cupriavidus]|uniref:hypothetical protein n=1 Tax=unclassified Cupriavidus TaxID=2640874 RepID=UPI001314EA21|nr:MULTISPECIES: hypothetical protein [unclassified Cupriavidus]